ncbi:ATP-dependent DNA helicase [Bifidobacterium rousetti]|uniref:ATP-dependent DNA helicase n=1 Tax=Bifidobacterium rousetti TaxID=2045439 RepID=UPI00123C1358|nr:ATP-dependent DNA helicase [Bifidobacterium rousetti]KAA8819910.1 ATP-dependent DNA helicase [Bifidobacterium rousetti]
MNASITLSEATEKPVITPVITPTEEQAAVIDAPMGDDVLVVAGAGSGKTFTMTRRITSLIERGVAPERILGLTFTRKAAGELLERVSAAVTTMRRDAMFLKPAVFTYDAFFQSIVRQYGLLVGFDRDTQPLSEAGALQIAANVIDRNMDMLRGRDLGAFNTLASRVLALSDAIGSSMIGGDVTDMTQAVAKVRAWDNAFAERVRDAIGGEPVPDEAPKLKAPTRRKKDTDETWAEKLNDYQRRQHEACVFTCANLVAVAETRDVLLDLVEAYAAEKRRLNMAEFSDFTIAAYQLATRFPSIGERYRHRFSHVLLDEYQDTSTTQAALLAALFHGEGTSVGAVGDPFQSIYAWRGASPGAFRMFQRDFRMPSDAEPYTLSATRRNSRLLLDAANDLTLPLRGTPRRAGSSLMREVDVSPLVARANAPLGTIGMLGYDTLGQEIDAVVRFCRHSVYRDLPLPADKADPWNPDKGKRSVAVLFRTKAHIAEYQEALERAGLDTVVVGYSAMLDRPEVRDVLALLHVAADHTDSASLMRLLATPRFGLDARTLTALSSTAERLNMETRYRALVAAGIAPADAPRGEWAAIVREHRNEVANAVFLPDVLLRGDLERLLDPGDGKRPVLTGEAKRIVLRASAVLRRVHDMVGRPLADVVREAVRALDLDVDTVLAQALRDADRVNPTLAHIPMDAVIDLVDTYTAEIAAGSTPTLRGFMAWVDALRSIEDETSTLNADRHADVSLMTIHQSKGLEWDAVAVVGLTDGGFPSNKGDHLKVELDENHPGGTSDGAWRAPEYRETARTWLDDPTAAPVPVRADAGILPRFPHDAPADVDPITALDELDGVEAIDDEVYGTLRGIGDGVDEVDPDSWHLTQREEYGRRLHADERRLMYVALTRAKEEVLLTYSRANSLDRVADDGVASGSRSAKPSNFWLEVHDALHSRDDVAWEPDNVPESMQSRDMAPDGYFVGERAQEFEDAVVGEAMLEPVERRDGDAVLPWPASLSETVESRLADAADAVRSIRGRLSKRAKELADSDKAKASDASDTPEESDAERQAKAFDRALDEVSKSLPGGGALLSRAKVLAADADLMAASREGDDTDVDKTVKARAQRILAGSRQSVTSLQARAGSMTEKDERRYWRGIVRPIPSVASPAASAGTRFHAWAERFVDAAIPGVLLDTAVAGVGVSDVAGGASGVTRAALLEDLAQRESALGPADAVERDLAVWQRRLAGSAWAARTPAWAERQLVAALPQLDGIIANGKLDAVFVGGLDPDDATKRYTIIDWKTGHRPHGAKQVAEKLVQLDLYRLLLSAIEGVPLDSIDAALYYVSEPDERLRQLDAEAKTEQDIIAELSSGVPEQSDDD